MLEIGGHSGMEPGTGCRSRSGILRYLSLGIVARRRDDTDSGMITSGTCNVSPQGNTRLTMIAAGAAYIEMAIVTLIANARYLLMSCAMSQRMDPDMPFFHRLLMAFDITDELFGITIARPGC